LYVDPIPISLPQTVLTGIRQESSAPVKKPTPTLPDIISQKLSGVSVSNETVCSMKLAVGTKGGYDKLKQNNSIQFTLNGKKVTVTNPDPLMSVNEYIRTIGKMFVLAYQLILFFFINSGINWYQTNVL
jgi:hypothetical protein